MNFAYLNQYAQKITFADEAVQYVAAGNRVRYAFGICQSNELDLALARRKEELTNVDILSEADSYTYAVLESSLTEKHFHLKITQWQDQEAFINPINKRIDSEGKTSDLIFMATVSPMDEKGYFWFAKGVAEKAFRSEIETAEYVIVEVNENIPNKIGCRIHISEVNAVVPSLNAPLLVQLT